MLSTTFVISVSIFWKLGFEIQSNLVICLTLFLARDEVSGITEDHVVSCIARHRAQLLHVVYSIDWALSVS